MVAEKIKAQPGFRTLRKWVVVILFSSTLLILSGLWFYFLGWGIVQVQSILFAIP
ncbi:hypothetical protein JXB22_10230 [candidate division WOR-3 bacterium]|nr:hypothetical protein [candidate division WOR-3 bacterium]